MTKKMKQALDDHAAPDAMRASARQIWQASLGAFARAQEEGGHVVARLAQDGVPSAALADDMVPLAGSTARDRLEQVVEERVARALVAIGAPLQAELASLRQQVSQLSRQVAELSAAAGKPAKKAAAGRKAAVAGSGKGGGKAGGK